MKKTIPGYTVDSKPVPGGIALTISCTQCGQTITHSNEYGMFCDNECGMAAAKKSKKRMDRMLKIFFGNGKPV